MVAAFRPVGSWPLALVAPAALTGLWLGARGARSAALIGFSFGMGLFGTGVSWVYVSLNQFGGMPAPVAALATLGFCVLLSLYPAAVGYLQARLFGGDALRACVAIPALWTLSEWLRGWLLTGFPWLATGYAMVPAPLAGFAPVGGVFAVTLVTWLIAGSACCALLQPRRVAGWVLLTAPLALGFALDRVEWTQRGGSAVRFSLLQGAIPQEMKFDEAHYARILATYERLAQASRAQLIVLPETAIPRFLERIDPDFLSRLETIARRNGGDLLLGVPVRDGARDYYNSAVSFGASPRQRYDKVHLVPFGEFVPPGFGWVLSVLRIPLSDFSAGSLRQRPLAIAGQKIAISVCYEDAFGEEVLRQLPEATLLVNVSNVAWFGDSLAPAQHLQIAQMRAIETRRTVLTATNTGRTAMISPDGSETSIAPFVEGVLESTANGYTGATPYIRVGNAAVILLALGLLAAAALLRKGAKR
ncbi:MAG: apolipoprotein N-acyltransferase [Betaproteobacteria bacterium]|nr:apolipoprotein N-acyltransferase [Betaproteobacteria bacterium]